MMGGKRHVLGAENPKVKGHCLTFVYYIKKKKKLPINILTLLSKNWFDYWTVLFYYIR